MKLTPSKGKRPKYSVLEPQRKSLCAQKPDVASHSMGGRVVLDLRKEKRSESGSHDPSVGSFHKKNAGHYTQQTKSR